MSGIALRVERWSANPAWRIAGWVIAVVVIVLQAVRVIRKTSSDFRNHVRMGDLFWDNEHLYPDGLNYVYPPLWGMWYAPYSRLPFWLTVVLAQVIGVAMMVILFKLLDRMTRRDSPLWVKSELSGGEISGGDVSGDETSGGGGGGGERVLRMWLVVTVVFLGSRFVLSDLTVLNANTVLVTLTWAGIYGWWRGRESPGSRLVWFAGFPIGLAIALKCTAGIFVPFFLWKRQWRFAVATTLWAGLFTVLPMIRQGPVSYQEHLSEWTSGVITSMGIRDPSIGILGPEIVQNNSLKPSLARFLMRLPDGHPGRIDHLLYFDFLNLSPSTAMNVIRITLLVLVGWVAWATRGRWEPPPPGYLPGLSSTRSTGGSDIQVVIECAGVSVLMLLLSPITWTGHCVAAIPALYVIVRQAMVRRRIDRATVWAITIYTVLVVLFNRTFVGRSLSLLLDSYSVQTIGLTLLLWLTLRLREQLRASLHPDG